MSSPDERLTRREVAKRVAELTQLAVVVPLSRDIESAVAAFQQSPPAPGTASPLGDRSPFEQPRRVAGATVSATPLQDLHGTLTPADLHYEVHHSGIPVIAPADYKLVVHGLVDRPTTFSLDALRSLPTETRTCFLECSGNYSRSAPRTATPQAMAGLLSQSEWTGVPVRVLLNEVGVRRGATWMLAEGGDAVRLHRSIPVEKGMDDALVAFAQNGEALRPAQGYPVRLVLPGWEGNTNVKWLRRLELGSKPFMTRWETSRYSDGLPGGRIRQFSFVMDARSIITSPAPPRVLSPGVHRIRGLAWSGRGRIVRVEVSTDDGRSWREASLVSPALPQALTAFEFMWRWSSTDAVLMSRAIDETGYVQPTLRELDDVRGTDTGPYHLNPIVAWAVHADGSIEFRPERA